MSSAGALIHDHRDRLGLSVRDLARLADVSYPTISRIENGHEDPRWSTLLRLASVLGFGLAGETPPRSTRLADLEFADDDSRRPDFTRLRAVVDQISMHPERIAVVIATAPAPSTSPLHDNILAAIAEKLADESGIRRPRWTRDVAPLSDTWHPPGTPSMRARNATQAPSQFAARGLLIAESAIWRTAA